MELVTTRPCDSAGINLKSRLPRPVLWLQTTVGVKISFNSTNGAGGSVLSVSNREQLVNKNVIIQTIKTRFGMIVSVVVVKQEVAARLDNPLDNLVVNYCPTFVHLVVAAPEVDSSGVDWKSWIHETKPAA